MEFRNKQQLAYARLYTFFRIFPQRNPLDFEIQNLRVLSSVEIWKLFFFLFFVSCEVRFLILLDQIRMKIRRISFSFLFFRTIKLGSGGWMNGSIPYYFDCTVR